jgi:hypothetical protein
MPTLNKKNAAALIAIPALFVALSGEASALDFNNPSDKRVFCRVYAEQALGDVRTSQSRGCSLTGASWSTQLADHFNWCMAQAAMSAARMETTNRANAAKQCSASAKNLVPTTSAASQDQAANPFPPVVSDEPSSTTASAPSAQSTNFPPVIDGAASTQTSSTTAPVVSQRQTSSTTRAGSFGRLGSVHVRHRSARERLIRFGHEHRREIRHAAHLLKQRLKRKFSEIANH